MKRCSFAVFAAASILAACSKPPVPLAPVPKPVNSDSLDRARADSIARADAARRAELARAQAEADSLRRVREAEERAAAANANSLNVITATIYFDFDKANLTDAAQSALQAKVPALQANPNMRIRITGHTDDRGSSEYNLALGLRRASEAKAFLVTNGIAAARIDVEQHGRRAAGSAGGQRGSVVEEQARRIRTNHRRKRTMRIHWLAPLSAVALAGCFATQQDVQVLQGDIKLLRTEQAASDSARRVQIDRSVERTLAALRVTNDSIAMLSQRLMHFRSDVTSSLSSVDQQLLQIQELAGQSQRRLQEVRASLEERQGAAAASPTPGDSTAPTQGAPGPDQLFQVAREQMMQGSNAAARQAFQDLLTRYPKTDLAADAEFYIAETYAAENNTSSADSAYARVATKYPTSPRAATAVYKRAVFAQTAGDTEKARALFNQVIKKYPRSDEAALARDRVRSLK